MEAARDSDEPHREIIELILSSVSPEPEPAPEPEPEAEAEPEAEPDPDRAVGEKEKAIAVSSGNELGLEVEQLRSMRLGALSRTATAMGVSPESLEQAQDADDPKSAIIKAIIASTLSKKEATASYSSPTLQPQPEGGSTAGGASASELEILGDGNDHSEGSPATVSRRRRRARLMRKQHEKQPIPKSPFGQRRCMLKLPSVVASGGFDSDSSLGVILTSELVVESHSHDGDSNGDDTEERVGKEEEDPTGTAALPIGWRVVAVEDSVVANKLQLTTAIKALGPKQRIAVTVHPATEHAKMCAVATKWQAIHRGRQARNPPPAIQSDDSDEELEAQKELGLLVRCATSPSVAT